MRTVMMAIAGLLFATSSWAVEIDGVSVPDSAQVTGHVLKLNGAGVRTKFFFDIYIGALYLTEKATTTEQVLAANGPKRVSMMILYDEVDRDKLTDGWTDGFEKNQSKEAMAKLRERLVEFNALFPDAKKGDVFSYDFIESGATVVLFNGRVLGVIEGKDFQKALIEVWLGKKPAHEGLKKAMLAGMAG